MTNAEGAGPTGAESAKAPALGSSDATLELPVFPRPDNDDVAEEVGAFGSGGSDGEGEGEFFDGADDEWNVRTVSRRVRMRVPTAILVALLIAAGAFWGGAAVQRGRGTSASSALSAIASRLRAAGGASGLSGASGFGRFGASSAAAIGTLTDVAGSVLYLTSSSGSLVKVELAPTTRITRTSTTKASGLSLGDTVIVVGTTGKNGTVSATSITATAAGTSSGGGGFGGFGGAGAGSGG